MNRSGKHVFRADERGFTLIELMISLMLGLLVVGAAGGLFLANQRTYAATEVISRLGESSRVSFEMMARDIREAAGNPCGRSIPVANVVNGAGGTVFDFGTGIIGYDNANPPSWPTGSVVVPPRVPGTDVLDMHSGRDSGVTVVSHNAPAAQFQLSGPSGLNSSDIAMVCDYTQASIFQVVSANDNGSSFNVVHNTGNSVSPGNCTKNLGLPVDCNFQCNNGNSSGDSRCKEYGQNATLVKIQAVRWYLGQNARGRSLYRLMLVGTGASAVEVDEITDKVDDLQFTYLVAGGTGYVPATGVTDWKKVIAVHVDLVMKGTDTAAAGSSSINRSVSFTINLRNRVD